MAAVSGFGMLLKHSPHLNTFSAADIIKLARKGRGQDREGYRAEFIKLVELYALLKK